MGSTQCSKTRGPGARQGPWGLDLECSVFHFPRSVSVHETDCLPPESEGVSTTRIRWRQPLNRGKLQQYDGVCRIPRVFAAAICAPHTDSCAPLEAWCPNSPSLSRIAAGLERKSAASTATRPVNNRHNNGENRPDRARGCGLVPARRRVPGGFHKHFNQRNGLAAK